MQKLQVNFIIEILGRPKERLVSSLSELVDRMDKEKGTKVLSRKINEPIPVKDSKDLFTTFAVVETELDSLEVYYGLIFAYMPSNAEVVYPENISVPNSLLNFVGANISQRLHQYDSIAKKMMFDNRILENKLREVAPHLFKQQPQQKSISKDTKKGSKKERKNNSKKKKS